MTRTVRDIRHKVMASVLAVILLLLALPSVAHASGETYTVRVATGYLALRTAPAYDEANEIGELYTGETVTVTGGYSGDYVWVRSNKLGREGYVNSNYLVRGSSGGGNSYSSGATRTVSVATGYLALRTAPAYDEANEIGELYSGETVTITGGYSGDYVWVRSNKLGREGYVNSKYLVGGGSSYSGSSRASGYTKTVRVATGYLALRTAPAYDEANEIGELYTGETVSVTNKWSGKYVWVYSPKLGKSGYVNGDYLY